MSEHTLREQLLELLGGGTAHIKLSDVVDDFPFELLGKKPKGAPHTAWQLTEHMRFTVNDLLTFSTDSKYKAPKWPDSYWPKEEAPASQEAWEECVKGLKADFHAFEKLVKDPRSNLFSKIPWGDGQTLLREVLLACTHTSYHLGELVFLKKELGAWD